MVYVQDGVDEYVQDGNDDDGIYGYMHGYRLYAYVQDGRMMMKVMGIFMCTGCSR